MQITVRFFSVKLYTQSSIYKHPKAIITTGTSQHALRQDPSPTDPFRLDLATTTYANRNLSLVYGSSRPRSYFVRVSKDKWERSPSFYRLNVSG